jgi:hypothetical protein
VLFGVQLIVTGIFRFVAAFAVDELTGGIRVLLAVLGVLSLIIGLYAVRHVLVTLLALALLLGTFWVVNGTAELFIALSRREIAGRAWTGLMGRVQRLRRPHRSGLSRHFPTDPGHCARRLAAGPRGHGDQHGPPGHVVPPPRRRPDDGPRHMRRPCRCP